MKRKLYLSLLTTILFTVIQTTFAQVSNALYFDGSNDRVTIPHITTYDLGLGAFTVETTIKANTSQNTSYPPILSTRTSLGSNGFLLFLWNGYLAHQAGGANYIANTGMSLLDGNCHHIAATRTTTNVLSLYLDGQLLYSSTQGQSVNGTGNFSIGYDLVTNQSFGGLIKEVRVWNVCRTPTEVTDNKGIQLSGSETGLIGYWRLDNGVNQVVDDFSASNNDGVLGTNPNVETLDPVAQSGCVINPFITGPVTAYGNTTFCTGGDVLLTATAPTGSTFQWKKNGVNIPSATTYKYTASLIGTYTCLITTLGVATLSNGIYVNVLTNPSNFIVNAAGATSFCAGSSSVLSITPTGSYTYQWFRGNLGIPGATNSTYTAFNPGSYKAVVTNTQNNCIRLSAGKTIAVTCRMVNPYTFSGAVNASKEINVYPNPAPHSFMIELTDDADINETVKLELINFAGQKVFETNAQITDGNLQYQLDADNTVADGLYTLIVSSAQRRYVSKVVIN